MLGSVPDAARTARVSAVSWTPSRRSSPSRTMLPKSTPPVGADAADGDATTGAASGVNPLMASMPPMLISAVRSGVRRCRCPGPCGGDDHLLLEGVLAGRAHGRGVGDVVGERVEPRLVHAQAAVGDAQHVEGPHHIAPAAMDRSEARSDTARVITWYWNCDCTAASDSWRRSTLLPSAPTGALVGRVVGVTPAADISPRWRAAVSDASKSTLVARNPGVSTLAMLSAITLCRVARPSRAEASTDETASGMPRDTGAPAGEVGCRSVGGG